MYMYIRIKKKGQLLPLELLLKVYPIRTIILLRLPYLSNGILNYLISLSSVQYYPCFIGNCVGFLPGAILFTILGSRIKSFFQILYNGFSSPKQAIIFCVSLTITLICIIVLICKARQLLKAQQNNTNNEHRITTINEENHADEIQHQDQETNLVEHSVENKSQTMSLTQLPLNNTQNKFLDFVKTKYEKLYKFIALSFIIITIDVLSVFFFYNFFKTSYNIVTILLFASILAVTLLHTKKTKDVLTYHGMDKHAYDKINLMVYLNFGIFLCVIFNYFYTLYDRFICDFYNVINIIQDDPKNLIFFYVGMLIYGTMNITVPLIVVYDSNKIKMSIKRVADDKEVVVRKNNYSVADLKTSGNDSSRIESAFSQV